MNAIALVISDVDGTLVTSEKRVTERTRQAVAALHARGIGFTIVSSRPIFGLRMLMETLGITTPVAAFNGGAIAQPDLRIITRIGLDDLVARRIVEFLDSRQVGVWVFTADAWVTRDPAGAYVERETVTVQQPPAITDNFDAVTAGALKIVGVSDDFARLEAIEKEARERFAGAATVMRSQRYYLDFVAPGIDKGRAVQELSAVVGVPLGAIATFGDMENDVPMFRESGFSVAMGNASAAVKREAKESTLSNDEDGFAAAIERLILSGAG